MNSPSLPPGQQLVAGDKWPLVGERLPAPSNEPWDMTVANWSVTVDGLVAQKRQFSLAELAAFPQVTRTIDIHCVTRWSKLGMQFTGAPLAAVLERCGVQPAARFVSFVACSDRRHSTSLPLAEALRLEVLLATAADGHLLKKEHGGPIRVVTPGLYFYKSVKWLQRIELLAEDRLGYWELTAGYHNVADPWQEQRYVAGELTRRDIRNLLETRDFTGRDLLGLNVAGHDLSGLRAKEAKLRNANFRSGILVDADFRRANLSNAHLQLADLQGARFNGADLEGANFCGADLRGADFREASLTAATFGEFGPDGAPINVAQIDLLTQFSPNAFDGLTEDQSQLLQTLMDNLAP